MKNLKGTLYAWSNSYADTYYLLQSVAGDWYEVLPNGEIGILSSKVRHFDTASLYKLSYEEAKWGKEYLISRHYYDTNNLTHIKNMAETVLRENRGRYWDVPNAWDMSRYIILDDEKPHHVHCTPSLDEDDLKEMNQFETFVDFTVYVKKPAMLWKGKSGTTEVTINTAGEMWVNDKPASSAFVAGLYGALKLHDMRMLNG